MLPNLSYTIPVVGRITIGDTTVNGAGMRLPVRLNHFRITTQYKREGEWVLHPLHAAVAAKMKVSPEKITEIPVKVLFNDPSLTIRERYEAYQDGRLICASCGSAKAKRATQIGMETVECLGPEVCQFAQERKQGCDLMARINVQIDADDPQSREDAYSTFILRTRGYNSDKSVLAKLRMISEHLGGKLIGIPLILKLRKKSTPVSFNSPFYYVDIVLACSPFEAAELANDVATKMTALGMDQKALEAAVKAGLSNGPFEDTVEEMLEMEDLLISSGSMPTEPVKCHEDVDAVDLKVESNPVVTSVTETTAVIKTDDAPIDISAGIGLSGLLDFIESTKVESMETA